MNFSSFFIARPHFAGVIALVMILAGAIAGFVLPISQYPDITPPQIIVSATYPGANASVLTDTVAIPIENQINGVEGMLYMSSTATDTGQYTLTITFDIGTDPDIAQVKVENRLDKAKPFLPQIVVQEGLDVHQQSANILAFVALTSPKGTYSPLYLSNLWLTIRLRDHAQVPLIQGPTEAVNHERLRPAQTRTLVLYCETFSETL